MCNQDGVVCSQDEVKVLVFTITKLQSSVYYTYICVKGQK